jgi:microtubule-associated protein-like 6
MKFSVLGDVLFVGGHDMRIHGFVVPPLDDTVFGNPTVTPGLWEDWKGPLAKGVHEFHKHSSAITHFDLSVDGKYIQSNDLGCELLFYDIVAKKQELSATKMAEYNGKLDDNEESVGRMWMTQSCVFGWTVQGLWPANSYDSSEINAVDRSYNMKYLATGEDSGNVRILRYPSVIPASQAIILQGHSSHVTNVKWTIDNQLVSVGGNDKCFFVWSITEK